VDAEIACVAPSVRPSDDEYTDICAASAAASSRSEMLMA
jgi:hypothetical protein